MSQPNSSEENPKKPSGPLTVHHLKLPASDLQTTYKFYTEILPFYAVPALNHYTSSGELYGALFSTSNPSALQASSPNSDFGVLVEVRQDKTQALAARGSDPITWGVPTRAGLQEWASWLDSQGVEHSPVLMGVKGWLLVLKDPDERFVRMYTTEEEHEWCEPDTDDYWLNTPK
ncbi:hypothetical protein F5Y16DRAFT_350808 [Xylariaceae sp. FL0255]|nr:hypothetical protein F5Y16DRAFT_350808 [Xylariaceae sp. FL0255]